MFSKKTKWMSRMPLKHKLRASLDVVYVHWHLLKQVLRDLLSLLWPSEQTAPFLSARVRDMDEYLTEAKSKLSKKLKSLRELDRLNNWPRRYVIWEWTKGRLYGATSILFIAKSIQTATIWLQGQVAKELFNFVGSKALFIWSTGVWVPRVSGPTFSI